MTLLHDDHFLTKVLFTCNTANEAISHAEAGCRGKPGLPARFANP